MPVEIYPPGSPYFSNQRGIGPVRLVNPPGGGGVAPPPEYGTDFAQPGFYFPTTGPFGTQAANPAVANRIYYSRIVPPYSMTITKIRFVVIAAATADDPVDVGILSANMLTLLGSSGSTLGKMNAIGVREVALAAGVPLVAGTTYYAGVGCGVIGGTAATIQMTNLVGGQSLFGGSAGPSEARYRDTGFPISPGIGNGATNQVPLLALVQ